MWTRVEVKDKGKNAFKANYWQCVLVSFILAIFLGDIGGKSSDFKINNADIPDVNLGSINLGDVLGNLFTKLNVLDSMKVFFSVSVFGIFLIAGIFIAVLFSVCIISALKVGGAKFFIDNSLGEKKLGDIIFGFNNGFYKNTILIMFFKELYTFLWSLLLIVPGIVKAYEYRMIPYLIAECPDIAMEDAFRISKEMMEGNKMDAFIYDLSFIGWQILSAFTLGILGIFYVNPYKDSADAELYLSLKDIYLSEYGKIDR